MTQSAKLVRSPGRGSGGDAAEDARLLSEIAGRYVADLEGQCRDAPESTPALRIRRTAQRSGQWFVRKGRELIQDHWDVGLFDVAFGSVKAFGIYPALYFAGLTWTIPIMEYAPLNTQLWTAGYLFARRHVQSRVGRRRYGHGLIEMDAFRDRALRIDPADARHIHRFGFGGRQYTVRVRRSRLRARLERVRGVATRPNVLLHAELRRMIDDTEFLFRANPLRNNTYLYEEIALQKILGEPQGRARLLARLVPEDTLSDARDRRLLDEIGESLIPAYARVIEQGDSLVASLRRHLDSGFSMTSMALRWISWSYQRTIYRHMRDLEVLQYRLIADLLDGRRLEASPHLQQIRDQRLDIRDWLDRATRFGARAKRLRSKAQAHEAIDAGLAEARELGLAVRLARTARRLSPSRRSAA